MPSHNTPASVFRPCLIHHPRQIPPHLAVITRPRQIQPQLPHPAVIDPRELQPRQTQTHPPVPHAPHQTVDQPVNIRLQIRRLPQALAPPALLHVIVTHPHLHAPDRLAVRPHFCHQRIRHPPQHAPHEILVRRVRVERLLLPVGLRLGPLGHERTLVAAVREFPQLNRCRPRNHLQAFHRRRRDLSDPQQPGRAHHLLHLRAHPRQPLHIERCEKFPLRPRRHLDETIRFPQLRRHRRHELVRPQPLRDRQPQPLADVAPQPLGRRARTPFRHPRKIEVSLVDRPHLDHRRVVVRERKHHPRKMLILLVIPRQHDQVRANLQRPRRRHRRVNPQPARLVTRRRDDPPPHPAHRNRLPAQARLGRHLAAHKKRVRIQMHRRTLDLTLHSGGITRKRILFKCAVVLLRPVLSCGWRHKIDKSPSRWKPAAMEGFADAG